MAWAGAVVQVGLYVGGAVASGVGLGCGRGCGILGAAVEWVGLWHLGQGWQVGGTVAPRKGWDAGILGGGMWVGLHLAGAQR